MTGAHLHLALNHVPVIGMLFCVFLLAYGMWRESQELIGTALKAFVIVALLAIPAYMTGEPAEEAIEALPEISENLVEVHEEFAEIAFISSLVTGALAFITLVIVRKKKELLARLGLVILSVGLLSLALLAWTAKLGGEIRHPEIRATNDSVP